MVRSIELFSGAGGLALGLHQAGFSPTALLEWDKNSCETLNVNIDYNVPKKQDTILKNQVTLI